MNQWGQGGGVTVVGEGVHTASPDTVEISLGVEVQAMSIPQVLRDHSTKASAIKNALIGMGISENDLCQADFTVAPVNGPLVPPLPGLQPMGGAFPLPVAMPGLGGTNQVIGYCMRSSLKILLGDMNQAADILDRAFKEGASSIDAIWFTVRDPSLMRQGALEKAGKDARAKAQTLAAAIGRQLGEPVAVIEEPQGISPATAGSPAAHSMPWTMRGSPFNMFAMPALLMSAGMLSCGARVQITYILH